MDNKKTLKTSILVNIIAFLLIVVLVIMYGLTKFENLKYQQQNNKLSYYQELHYKNLISEMLDFKNYQLDKTAIKVEEFKEINSQEKRICYQIMDTVEFIKAKYDKQPFGLAEIYTSFCQSIELSEKVISEGDSKEAYMQNKEKLDKEIEAFMKMHPNLIEELNQGKQDIFIK